MQQGKISQFDEWNRALDAWMARRPQNKDVEAFRKWTLDLETITWGSISAVQFRIAEKKLDQQDMSQMLEKIRDAVAMLSLSVAWLA